MLVSMRSWLLFIKRRGWWKNDIVNEAARWGGYVDLINCLSFKAILRVSYGCNPVMMLVYTILSTFKVAHVKLICCTNAWKSNMLYHGSKISINWHVTSTSQSILVVICALLLCEPRSFSSAFHRLLPFHIIHISHFHESIKRTLRPKVWTASII